MNESSLNLLLLGDSELDDFWPVVEFLQRYAMAGAERTAVDFSVMRQLINGEGWHPDLVVACEAWPDQFSEVDVHELLTLCPLARIICCFGPWCDSDGRTRSIWPIAVRVPVAAAKMRIAQELAILANRQPAFRPLPLTASRAEIFEFDFRQWASAEPLAMTAKVISPDRRWREMLQAALGKRGFRFDAAGAASSPDVILFDSDPWDARQEAALRAIREAHPQTKLVACMGFPRSDIDANLRRLGADEVWFKLAPLEELVAELCQHGMHLAQ